MEILLFFNMLVLTILTLYCYYLKSLIVRLDASVVSNLRRIEMDKMLANDDIRANQLDV